MAPREKTFLLARPEAAALRWLARRVPRRLVPDHFTALALAAALGIAAAYALSGAHPWLLWAAAGLLVVHWLGDSLDGTLARERRIERPRYGYYLDHLADAVADGADRHRPRPLAPPRARLGHGAGHRLLRAVDQHLPRDARARRVPPRLWAARADGGAARPDRADRGAGARRRAPARRDRARRERADGRRPGACGRRGCSASWRCASPRRPTRSTRSTSMP